MPTIHPVQSLMNEHRVIERVLGAVEIQLGQLGETPFPADFFQKALDFLRVYADSCHHFKEEDTLFPAMNQKGFPKESGPIGMMLYEHQVGRSYLAQIRDNLAAAARNSAEAIEAIRENGFAYVELLRAHIQKEDRVLFQMAYQVLDTADFEKVDAIFSDESNAKINIALHRHYEALAEELCLAASPEPVHD